MNSHQWPRDRTQQLCSSLLSFLAGKQDRYILSPQAFRDPNLPRLAELGYLHLYGIGAHTDICNMPYYTKIKYLVADPAETHFPEGFFDYVYLAHSPVECTEVLLREFARILSDNGTLIIITDSDPQGINRSLLTLATKLGFKETYQKVEELHSCSLHALKRTNSNVRRLNPSVNLVCPTLGLEEGLAEYTLHLKTRLEQAGIRVNLYRTWRTIQNKSPTIIEYEPRLHQEIPDEGFIIEAHRLPARHSILIELHNVVKRVLAKPSELFQLLRLITLDLGHLIEVMSDVSRKQALHAFQMNLLLVRSNELARLSGVRRYVIMPHIAYRSTEPQTSHPKEQIHLGSFGFASKAKNFDKICDQAKKLKIPLTLMLSINRLNERTEREGRTLAKQLQSRYASEQIRIQVGFFSEKELRTELTKCTHLISAQDDSLGTSGSLRYMISTGRPVISVDNMQAREAQVYRVKNLRMLTIKYLSMTNDAVNSDDGFRYLMKYLESLPEIEPSEDDLQKASSPKFSRPRIKS